MNSQDAIDLGRDAVMQCLLIASPVLIVGLIVAIVVGVLQSITHVHDQTVTFVPKVVLIAIALAFCLPWLSDKLIDYSRTLFAAPVILSRDNNARDRITEPAGTDGRKFQNILFQHGGNGNPAAEQNALHSAHD
jgi:flagellar biosynthetic protein FliQ